MYDRLAQRVAAVSVIALVGWTITMSSAHAGEAPSLDGVGILSEQVDWLEETYLVPAVLESRYRVETRFNDAKVAYILGEYQRASILFVAVVDAAEVRRFDSYREALYLLGDSLYQVRNFRAARDYFRQLLELGPGPFYQSAIVQLLEIAGEIDDYSEVDALYERLDDLEDVSAAIHYTRGKTLYEQGRFRSARPWFQRAARDDRFTFTARYFEGVTLAAAGELEDARELFERLTRQGATRDQDYLVIDLAHLALGRLSYEKKDFDQAIDHYLQLPRTSPYFDRALFELTWALVANGSYRAALRNLDILMISDPDPRFVPEAKSLMADMSMRLREYDNARRWFGDLVETFTPVRAELRQFIETQDDLESFFVGLVRDELDGLRPDFLPEMVTEWVDDDDLMQTSRRLVGDGAMTQADIDETYQAIEEIEELLGMGSAIEAFPALAEGWAMGIELEARLVDVQYELLDWELRQIQPLLGPADRERLERLDRELDTLREREAQTPRTRDELKERDRQIRNTFRALQSDVDRVAFDIAGLEESLDGIAEYMRQGTSRLNAEEQAQVEEIRRELREEVQQLQEERRRLSRELERTQRSFGARDDSLVRQRELRDEIQILQAQRAEMVDNQSDYLEAAGQSEALRVARTRRQIPRLKQRLDRYFDQLDHYVDERMVDIRTTLESERVLLAGYQGELDQWVERTEGTVSAIALWNFIKVEQEFERLVRRGYVGLVDVDWQQLEDARRDHEDLMDEKTATEDMLREVFDVR